MNPLTIASFAAVAAALSLDGAGRDGRVRARRRRRLGGLAPGAHARRRPRRALDYAGDPARPLAIGGRVLVLAIAAHLGAICLTLRKSLRQKGLPPV